MVSIPNRYVNHLLIALGVQITVVGDVFGQTDGTPGHYTLGGQLIFWMGGVALMALIGRQIFKEQLNERRTLSRLIKEIGPFYPEFDIDNLKKWVHLCAPHVWAGWQTGEWTQIDSFVTESFKESMGSFLDSMESQGHTLDSQLLSVLKVHPLGLYMVGDGPAPQDVELMLRLEQKADYCVRDASGKLIQGQGKTHQIQHFWTLRHDGIGIRLDRVWLAENDATDLEQRIQPPVVTEWVSGRTSNS